MGVAALPTSLLMGYLYQRLGAGLAFTTWASLADLAALLLLILHRPSSPHTRKGRLSIAMP